LEHYINNPLQIYTAGSVDALERLIGDTSRPWAALVFLSFLRRFCDRRKIQSMGKEAELAIATRFEQEAQEHDRAADETEKLLSWYSEGVSRDSARQYVVIMRNAAELARDMAKHHKARADATWRNITKHEPKSRVVKMNDFLQETIGRTIRFRPLTTEAKKYVKERTGFFTDFYNKTDGYICFPLPIEKDTAENYRNRLVKAGFKIQVI